jgi:hypothetical protein
MVLDFSEFSLSLSLVILLMMLCCRSVGLCLSAQPNKTLSLSLAQTPVNQMKCESFFFFLFLDPAIKKSLWRWLRDRGRES